ncbi:MAG TPA: flagellar hook-associated protein FlgK [Spirochaetia bacterium]|nr:flagellar hook-associated protein FlgK [Spirochaetia bacterium]
MGIEIGKRALVANTQAMATIGHNLSNASTPGYSRERVELTAFDPLYMPDLTREDTPGQIGQGVVVASVRRIHDQILEGRIVAQGNGQGYWKTMDQYLLMVSQVYNEPTNLSVRGLMDKFWSSFQELSVHPDQMSAREQIVQNSQALMDGIHQRYHSLKTIRDLLEQDIETSIGQINDKMSQIAALNKQITQVKAMGDSPNDLLDRRDLLVKELSGYLNITVDNRDPDEFNVHTGGMQLIQGGVVHYLKANPDLQNEGYSTVSWASNNQPVQLEGGKLAALVQLRDGDVKHEVQKLDNMTINFADLVNQIHRQGFGLNGKSGVDFFREFPFVNNPQGNYDRSGNGTFDSTYLFRITGANTLKPKEQIGLNGTITLSGPNGNVTVDYHPTDTVDDVIKRIDASGAQVVAYLDRNGKLTLKATPSQNENFPDFVLRHVQDSGQFLVGYSGILNQAGAAGAYDWGHANAVTSLQGGGLQYAVAPLSHPSGWIELNPQIAQDPGMIAAGLGQNGRPAGPGDGSAALAIAGLRTEQVMIGQRTTFDEYFASSVADIGLKSQVAKQTMNTQDAIMKDLEDQKQAISGVNIDEELSNMIKFQHGYAAAARFITDMNQMLDTLINRTGV